MIHDSRFAIYDFAIQFALQSEQPIACWLRQEVFYVKQSEAFRRLKFKLECSANQKASKLCDVLPQGAPQMAAGVPSSGKRRTLSVKRRLLIESQNSNEE